jgi:hypothetical protein
MFCEALRGEAKLWRGVRRLFGGKELLCMTIEKAVGQELCYCRTKKGLSQEKLLKFA